MKRFFYFIVGILVFNIVESSLLAGSLTVSVDKNEASIYDQFHLKVKVSGDFDDKVKIPEIPGVSIRESGVSRSFNIINGASSKSVEYNYVLSMDKEGTYTIPEIELKIDGNVEKSEKIDLKVVNEVSDNDDDNDDNNQNTGDRKNKDIFLERKIEPESVYLGETILVRSLFYYRTNVNDLSVLSKGYPDTLQTVVSKKNKNYSLVKNGIEYNVLESSDILLPSKIGEIEIPAFVVKAQIPDKKSRSSEDFGFGSGFGSGFFDDFFSRTSYVSKIFTSKGKTIKVKPLPKPVPSKFSGLVGSFKISTSLSKQELNVGDTTTLTVSVEGEGYLEGLNEKSLRINLDKSLKVYADKPSFTRNDGKILKETKVFKFALVPTKKIEIPSYDIVLNVFVPKLGTYVDLSSTVPEIKVTGDGVVSSSSNLDTKEDQTKLTNKNDVRYLNQDIKDIKRKGFKGIDSLCSYIYKNCFYILIIPTVLILLKIILIILAGISNEKSRRKAKAYKKFISRLSNLDKKKGDINLNEVKDIFFNYLEQRFGSKVRSKTVEELISIFKKNGVDDSSFIGLLRKFDSLIYGGSKNISINGKEVIDILKKQVDKINSIRL